MKTEDILAASDQETFATGESSGEPKGQSKPQDDTPPGLDKEQAAGGGGGEDGDPQVFPGGAALNLAATIFDMATSTTAAVFGDEWLPGFTARVTGQSEVRIKEYGDREKNEIVQALAIYLEMHKIKDIPPGYLLLLLAGVYIAPRGIYTYSKIKQQHKQDATAQHPAAAADAAAEQKGYPSGKPVQ